jgi:hypothetical protein
MLNLTAVDATASGTLIGSADGTSRPAGLTSLSYAGGGGAAVSAAAMSLDLRDFGSLVGLMILLGIAQAVAMTPAPSSSA